MIIFRLVFKMLKNPILIVDLSTIVLNAYTCTRCLILENGLHVDDFKKKKKTFALSNYACYNQNTSKY
jgi:hypothetical protein